MTGAVERLLAGALKAGACCIGQVAIEKRDGSYLLRHRDDRPPASLCDGGAEAGRDLAKTDDAGKYRPLKTAPTLRHGWQLATKTVGEVAAALDNFYPGRMAAFAAWKNGSLTTTPLRETLERQTGMYKIAAKITDEQIDGLVGNFCRSDGGCLRTILWKRDAQGTVPSSKLPVEKYDPAVDQYNGRPEGRSLPLLCQEACALLIEAARRTVKLEGAAE